MLTAHTKRIQLIFIEFNSIFIDLPAIFQVLVARFFFFYYYYFGMKLYQLCNNLVLGVVHHGRAALLLMSSVGTLSCVFWREPSLGHSHNGRRRRHQASHTVYIVLGDF